MDEWVPTTIGDCVDRQADRYGSTEALVLSDTRLNYRELKAHSDAAARSLLMLGIRKGDRVAIWLGNSPEWVYTWLGVAKIGAILVPINTRYKSEETRYILRHSNASVLVIDDGFLNIDFVSMLYEICPELRGSSPGTGQCSTLPALRHVVCVSHRSHAGLWRFEEIISQGKHAITAADLTESQASVDPWDVAQVQYTSGTTAFPKGAMLRHDALLRNGFYTGERIGVREGDRYFGGHPFYHGGGSVILLFVALTRGATAFGLHRFDAKEALAVMERERCTHNFALQTMMIMELEHPELSHFDLSSLRGGNVTASPEILMRAYHEMGLKEIVTVYGLTEGSQTVTIGQYDEPLGRRIHCMGRPLPGIEVEIVDPITGEPLPASQVGEIRLRGWCAMAGYYGQPEETAKTIRDDWLYTGDLGTLDDAGYLTYQGRLKDMVRVGGENVSSEELEAFLYRHPKVKQAHVIGVPDKRLGEVCMAWIQLKANQQATEEEIINFCRSKIANFKVPRYVKFVDNFPMTPMGKVLKYKLKEWAVQELELDSEGSSNQ